MELTGKTPKEIQQQIFDEISKGTSADVLAAELKHNGLHPEGYYFTTKESHHAALEQPKEPAGAVSGKQIFWFSLSLIFIIIKVVRCNMLMNR